MLEAWRTNNRINLYLLDHISRAGMAATLSKRGGRGVAGQFGHMHNIRLAHLVRRAPDLAIGLEKFSPKEQPTKAQLKKTLQESGRAVEQLLADLLSHLESPERKGFKKGPATMLAYFVSHESHHRGIILTTLKECGHSPDKAARYKIWDWDRI